MRRDNTCFRSFFGTILEATDKYWKTSKIDKFMEILPQIPASFTLGPFELHTYGLILGVSVVIALYVAIEKAPKALIKDSKFKIFLVSMLLSALIGARLLFVILNFDELRSDLLEMFRIWNGGMALFGGILGVFLCFAGFWFGYFKEKYTAHSFWELADILAVALALGQSIGRWGNYVNQELYGLPTDLPWGIYINPENRQPEFKNSEYFHPAFLYESLLNLFNFIFLSFLYRFLEDRHIYKKWGFTTAAYLVNYGIIRIVVERFRVDSSTELGLFKVADVFSLAMVAIGMMIFLYRMIISKRSTIDAE